MEQADVPHESRFQKILYRTYGVLVQKLDPVIDIMIADMAVSQAGEQERNAEVEGNVDAIVDRVGRSRMNPFDVRPEARPAGQIQRQVHPQARGLGHRVDQPREGRAAGECEVVALGVTGRWHTLARQLRQQRRNRGRPEARRVDDRAAHQLAGRLAADLQHVPIDTQRPAEQRRLQRDPGAGRLQIAPQGEHQRVAVDDAGGGRQQCAGAVERGFEGDRVGRGQPAQVGHTLGRRLRLDAPQVRHLRLGRGHDQLAAAPMWHAVALAEVVELGTPEHAQARLQPAGRVVEAGMHDLAVARTGRGADRGFAFQHHGLEPAAGEGTADRQADHSGTDHDGIDPVHGS